MTDIKRMTQGLVRLYMGFGFESKQTIAIKNYVDIMLMKCNDIIKNGNKELEVYLRKRILNKDTSKVSG